MALLPKFAALVVKTLAKPVANRIKARAAENATFRTICVAIGRKVNQWSLQMQIWASGHKPVAVRGRVGRGSRAKRGASGLTGGRGQIKELSETKAVNRGAEVVGEFIIFSIGGGAVVAEYVHRKAKDARAAAEKERRRRLHEKVRAGTARLRQVAGA